MLLARSLTAEALSTFSHTGDSTMLTTVNLDQLYQLRGEIITEQIQAHDELRQIDLKAWINRLEAIDLLLDWLDPLNR